MWSGRQVTDRDREIQFNIPFLRFLELHVAGEQQNNAEKAEFPLGPRVKLLPP